MVGNIICFIANNVLYLSAGYAFLGLSCGAFGLIFTTIIGSQKNASDANSGFAHYNASYLAGVNVGVVFGALVAQFFPYRTLFGFSSIIAVLFFAMIVYSIRSTLFNHYYEDANIPQRIRKVSIDKQYVNLKTKRFGFIRFIFKPVVFFTLLMAFIPYVTTTSFVEYFMPVFAMNNGLGEANIGQLMLLNGLFAIMFGTALCKIVAKKIPVMLAVVFPILLNAAALYLFSFNVSVSMLIIAVFLLAIVNIFASTNIQTYFSFLYQTEGILSVKALGVYNIIENLGLAIGPVLFSYILAGNIGFGIRIMAGIIFGCTILFATITKLSVKWSGNTIASLEHGGGELKNDESK